PPDGRVPRPHPLEADLPGRPLPRRRRRPADDPDQPDLGQLLLRRHLDPDRRRRRARHGVAARGAADDAQLRGVPQITELNLVLLGPPGSGKGTQGERLQEDFRLPYWATGDILRAAVKEGTEVGKEAKKYMDAGDLVPDEVLIGIIAENISSPDAGDGFIPDGVPRRH